MPISSRYITSVATNKTNTPAISASSTVSAKPPFHVKPSAPVKLLASSRYTSPAVVPASKSNPLLVTSSRYIVSTPPPQSNKKPQTPSAKK